MKSQTLIARLKRRKTMQAESGKLIQKPAKALKGLRAAKVMRGFARSK